MFVIGAGPIGSYVSYLLSSQGFKIEVYEEHRRIGYPEHCAGIISRNIESFVRNPPYLQFVHGAKFFAGREFALLERKKAAYIIDRPALDKLIAEMAESEGAKIFLGKKAYWKDFRGKIIAADGSRSITRYELGQRVKFLPALQFDVREKIEDFAEVWFEPRNKDFFVWVIPRVDHVRVGTAGNVKILESFLRKRFGRKRIIKRYSGLVIVSGPVKRTYFKFKEREVALVGDSAGQVKPTTGGGVVTGLICARELANSIIAGDMSKYEKLWRKKLSFEFFAQKIARHLILKDPISFVNFLKRAKIKFEEYGDMEMQSKVVFKALPQALSFILSALTKKH